MLAWRADQLLQTGLISASLLNIPPGGTINFIVPLSGLQSVYSWAVTELGFAHVTIKLRHIPGCLAFQITNLVKKLSSYTQITLSENCFWTQFWTSGSAPTRKFMKMKMCVFMSFLVGHFPKSKIKSKSGFW